MAVARHLTCRVQTCPLHLAACRSGSLPVLELLLGAGAVVDQTDADQWTALHFAALHGWQEGIRVLLDKGANPNAVTAHGSTALQVSVASWHEYWLHSNTPCMLLALSHTGPRWKLS